jgi:hypothetical protein
VAAVLIARSGLFDEIAEAHGRDYDGGKPKCDSRRTIRCGQTPPKEPCTNIRDYCAKPLRPPEICRRLIAKLSRRLSCKHSLLSLRDTDTSLREYPCYPTSPTPSMVTRHSSLRLLSRNVLAMAPKADGCEPTFSAGLAQCSKHV